jgi:hypothetical protein
MQNRQLLRIAKSLDQFLHFTKMMILSNYYLLSCDYIKNKLLTEKYNKKNQ